MAETTTSPRLYLNLTLKAGISHPADAQAYHYLMNVMRFKTKDKVRLFNESDGEWSAEVEVSGKKSILFNVLDFLKRPVLCNELTLFFAPLKRAVMDFLIEKGTELGVTHFVPVITEYTQKSHLNWDKYKRTAIEAAEQCERFDVPEILEPRKLMDAVSGHKGTILWADETLSSHPELVPGSPCCKVQKRLQDDTIKKAILIGPEGGFSEKERLALRACDNVSPCHLGSRILRAETAALALLAYLSLGCD